jgi:hypothetical protein
MVHFRAIAHRNYAVRFKQGRNEQPQVTLWVLENDCLSGDFVHTVRLGITSMLLVRTSKDLLYDH